MVDGPDGPRAAPDPHPGPDREARTTPCASAAPAAGATSTATSAATATRPRRATRSWRDARRRRRRDGDARPADQGPLLPEEWYEDAVGGVLAQIGRLDDRDDHRGRRAMTATDRAADELALARIARERDDAGRRLAKTRDIAAWQATMARLDAEEAVARRAAGAVGKAPEIVDYLRSLRALGRRRTRRTPGAGHGDLRRLEVQGFQRMDYELTPMPSTGLARRYRPHRARHKDRWSLVGARGFEPPTSSSRTMRATKLRHAPTEGARLTEPADDTASVGEGSAARGQPDRVVADVLGRSVLRRRVIDPQRAPLGLGDRVRDAHVERAPAAGAAGGHDHLVGELLARRVEDRDPERGLEDVRAAGDPSGVAERGAEGRSVDEHRRQLIGEVRTADGTVQDDPFAAEHGHRLALDLEDDRLDGRELGQRVDDLGEAELHRGRAAARIELGREVDGRDAVLDGQAEQVGAGRDRGTDRRVAVTAGDATEEGAHGRRRDGDRLRHLAQGRHEALDPGLAIEHEVGPDDHRLAREWRVGLGVAVGPVLGSPEGSVVGDSDGVALGSGVRSGPGSTLALGVGEMGGTAPEVAAGPTAGGGDQHGPEDERDREALGGEHRMGSSGRNGVSLYRRPRTSQDHRRDVTIRSQAIGGPGAGRHRSRASAVRSPPSSSACSAAIARPRPLLPAWRDGSAL